MSAITPIINSRLLSAFLAKIASNNRVPIHAVKNNAKRFCNSFISYINIILFREYITLL